MLKEPIIVIIDIIKKYMSLNNNQIYSYSQAYQILPNQLNVMVQFMNSKVYGNNKTSQDEILNNQNVVIGLSETITTYIRQEYQIDIFAYDKKDNNGKTLLNEAIARHYEVIQALISSYSKEMQSKYAFTIATTPTVLSSTEIEGSEMLKRFTVQVPILTWYSKTTPIQYYDTFNAPNLIIEQ
jgi:hypothetical protein